MVVVAEQEHGASLLGMAAHLLVHLRDQRAGGVDEAQAAVDRFGAHLRRDPVSGEDDPRAVGHLVQLLHEDGAALLEILDDVSVVHDLAAHVDRCAEAFERGGHGVDGALDTGAERARRREQDLPGIGGRRPLLHQRREAAERAQRDDAALDDAGMHQRRGRRIGDAPHGGERRAGRGSRSRDRRGLHVDGQRARVHAAPAAPAVRSSVSVPLMVASGPTCTR